MSRGILSRCGHRRKWKTARRNTDSRVEQMNERRQRVRRSVVKGKHFGAS